LASLSRRDTLSETSCSAWLSACPTGGPTAKNGHGVSAKNDIWQSGHSCNRHNGKNYAPKITDRPLSIRDLAPRRGSPVPKDCVATDRYHFTVLGQSRLKNRRLAHIQGPIAFPLEGRQTNASKSPARSGSCNRLSDGAFSSILAITSASMFHGDPRARSPTFRTSPPMLAVRTRGKKIGMDRIIHECEIRAIARPSP